LVVWKALTRLSGAGSISTLYDENDFYSWLEDFRTSR